MPQISQVIRRFSNNASEMKRLAARDYEDLLQVSHLTVMLCGIITAARSVPSWHSRICLMSPTTNGS